MTTTCSTSTADAASVLREAMVRELREWGAIRSEPVEQAALTVPRHLFAPGEPIEAAYEPNKPLVVKRDEQGLALSSLSATHIQVVMLEQARPEPGMRVLEVGSGGYNAALIAEMVGESGTVVSLDIDAEIVPSTDTPTGHRGTGSSSRPGPGTSRRPGSSSWHRVDASSCRCGCAD